MAPFLKLLNTGPIDGVSNFCGWGSLHLERDSARRSMDSTSFGGGLGFEGIRVLGV